MTRTRSRPGRALVLATAALLAGVALAPAAAGAQDTTALIVSLQLANTSRHSFQNDLQTNCNLFFSNGTSPEGNPQFATASGPPSGSLDFAKGKGEGFVKRTGWQVEPLPPTRGRPTLFADIGISLQGRNVFLTARVTHGRPFISAARRQRLGIVRGAKRRDGPLLDSDGKPAPDTFSFIAQGKLKMLPVMSKALERTRCKDRHNRASKRLKAGYDLGKLTVGLRPDHATGLGGDVQFKPDVAARGEDEDQQVPVEPTGGVTQDSKHVLTAPLVAGAPVPLTCEAGTRCVPSSGSFALGGGFDLVFGGRRTSVANLSVTTTGAAPDALRSSLAGTLDRAPVAVSDGGTFGSGFGLSDDFAQRGGAALGVPISGGIDLVPRFTRTGP
jgi:hypothetical protein